MPPAAPPIASAYMWQKWPDCRTTLIDRANQILKQLEESRGGESSALQDGIRKISTPQLQLSIFDAHTQTFDQIRKMLNELDINRLTPVEALLKLNEIKGLIQ